MLFNEIKIDLKSPIKWAGGKSFLLEKIEPYIDTYCDIFVELFSGSLALTLHFQPKKAIINDICSPLINMWTIIKTHPEQLCKKLKKINGEDFNNKEKFNDIKTFFNENKDKELSINEKIKLASYFIYLNKRSFNGLYRENKNGKYNVPYRKYSSEIYDENNIMNISKYFNENEITFYNKSYKNVNIPNNSFVYIDPPYYPCKTSSFVAYHKNGFSVEEQISLKNFCDQLNTKNIKFLQSNAPCEEIFNLYENFQYEPFFIKRSMRSAIKGKTDDDNVENNEIFIFN